VKRETYAAAHERLLSELWKVRGMHVRTDGSGLQVISVERVNTRGERLKSPYAVLAWRDWPTTHRIKFRPQAIYLDQHSLFFDARGRNVDELLSRVGRALEARDSLEPSR
jgi:hypothetical protein